MPLKEMLDRLATFEPVDLPVISLYLNTRADGRGGRNILAKAAAKGYFADEHQVAVITRRDTHGLTGKPTGGNAEGAGWS